MKQRYVLMYQNFVAYLLFTGMLLFKRGHLHSKTLQCIRICITMLHMYCTYTVYYRHWTVIFIGLVSGIAPFSTQNHFL